MRKLSKPIADLKNEYEVVIIGSGYGASIAASRFSRSGYKVCVLEKGKEFQPGDYPDTLFLSTSSLSLASNATCSINLFIRSLTFTFFFWAFM